jgi:hypothetical protein
MCFDLNEFSMAVSRKTVSNLDASCGPSIQPSGERGPCADRCSYP